jgi:hypothetical protein
MWMWNGDLPKDGDDTRWVCGDSQTLKQHSVLGQASYCGNEIQVAFSSVLRDSE